MSQCCMLHIRRCVGDNPGKQLVMLRYSDPFLNPKQDIENARLARSSPPSIYLNTRGGLDLLG